MRKWFVLFVIAVLPLAVFADAVQIGSLWYNLNGSTKTAEVTSSGGDAYSGDIVIPATVSYGGTNYNVSKIGDKAFEYGGSISSVVIPEGIETIGNNAFRGCYNMSVESWPSTLKSIGNDAFWNCNGIRKLVFASGLKTIGDNAFSWCYGLNEVVFPTTLSSIGEGAFRGCPIKKLELPTSLTRIGDWAFASLGELSYVISNIQTPFTISESVFCSGYSSSWSDVEQQYVYTYTPSEATLYVPSGRKSAYQSIDGWNMFADIIDGELKEATVDGLKYSYVEGKGNATVIGRADEELRNITIPATVHIGNTNYPVKTVDAGAFQSCGIETLVISEGVETIKKNAFRYNNSLKSVTFPTSLKTIGNETFYNCSGLKQLELPSSLTEIGDRAFCRCDNLSSVTSRIKNPFEISQSVFCSDYNDAWSEAEQQYVYTYIPSGATLYVPSGRKSAYQSIAGWNMFTDIVEGELKEATVDGLKYSYVEGKGNATVIGRADEELLNITIPATVHIGNTNYAVKTVGIGAFQSCGIETLVISEGIETIEKNAFRYNYSSLKSVTLPTSLRTIGNEAFYNCYGIRQLIIPQGVTTIGDYAFYNCHNFKQLVIPQGVISIGEGAFIGCSGIQQLELPSSLTKIGDRAFCSCDNLSSVTSRIKNPFDISQSVFCLSYSSSWSNEEQKEIYTYTPSEANLYVPEGTSAKYKEYKGWNMFAGIYEGELQEAVVDSIKYSYLASRRVATVVSGDYSDYTAITIPATVTINGVSYQVKEIGVGAFQYCYNLQNVTISKGIETVGKSAFSECYNADFGTFPSSLKTIGDNAFYNCNKLVKLELNEGLLSIGNYAFRYCSNMQKVTLPSSLTSIGYRAFDDTGNLTAVVSRIQNPFEISKNVFGIESWNSAEQRYDYTICAADLYVPEGKIEAYKKYEGWTMFRNIYDGNLKEITIGDLAYSLNSSTKEATVLKEDNYSEIKTVSVPSTIKVDGVNYSVKEIGARAFSGTSIVSVEIATGIETIAQEAFSNCEQLSKLSLPSTLVTIEQSAFNNCRRLTGIKIPASVKTIGSNALSGCYNLESIEVVDGNKVYESLGSNVIVERNTNTLLLGCKNSVIPSSVAAIGAEAFYNCQIARIQIPESVKSIGYNAFASCDYLTEVTLPEGIDSIASGAFRDCNRLVTIEFPKTLRYLGERSFAYCNSLLNVVSNIEEPKGISESVFEYYDGSIYRQATLWVPKGKIDTYKQVAGWKRFEQYDELLHDILTRPTLAYNGRYLVMTNNTAQKAKIYYSMDGSEPTILYSDTVTISNLGTIQAISKRIGSYTVDTTRYEITYVFDGVSARTSSAGLLAKAFEWCGTDKVEMLDIDATLNDDDFGTIRSLSNLKTLNMAASKIKNGTIPAEAFANMKLQWYVSPYTMTSVGNNIFKGCQRLTAITWNSSSIELPKDVVTDVANPNMLVYAKAQAMIPYALKNVIVNGVANNIILTDSAGNNNFICPEQFLARHITYTHNYQQKTARGVTQGWETLALPFTVSKIVHETKGVITPMAVEDAEKPFWLYELGDNGLEAATQIKANVPYLICMPNNDAYGDEYILGGRVTFSASNVTISTSGGKSVSQGDRQFVPTYQVVAKADGVYALNVGQAYNNNPMGSVFVPNYREIRPFEAYSVHGNNKSRMISVSSLVGSEATGINDVMLRNDGQSDDSVVKVYSLSGALVKQGKREEVLRSLPKGLYIIDGKKVIK